MQPEFFKTPDVNSEIVFIVEDNEVYAKSLQTFLQNNFPKIKEISIFSIGEICLMKMDRKPGIVIMDYFLNSKYEKAQNGLDIIKRIKALNSNTEIIVLSVQKDIDIVLEIVNHYNCFYVQKDGTAFNKVRDICEELVKRKRINLRVPEPDKQ